MAKSERQQTDLDRAGIRYIRAGLAAGCPADQLQHFTAAGIWLQQKQLEFAAACRRCDAEGGPIHVGLGGSRGPGKTHAIIAQMGADDCQRFAGLKVLFLRKVAKANKEQFNDFRVKIFGALRHNYREQRGELEFDNGSKIVIGHFKDEKDIDNYLGLEYDEIVIEELTTLSFEKWKNVLSCLRTSKEGWRPRTYSSWNWGGVGHAWVKSFFYDPMVEKRQKDTLFIRSTVYDNRFVNKEYRQYLETLTGWKRKSWLEGDPNFQAGQFFTTWSEQAHVLRAFDERLVVRWYGGMDYGWTHPNVFLLAGEVANGDLVILDEHSASQMTVNEHATNIFAMLRRRQLMPRDLDFIAAGRDCFSKKEDGTTIADSYAAEGIELMPAEVDRINGWAKLLARLGDPEKGIRPTLFVHECCRELISQIPLAQHHERRPEDIEKMNASPEDDSGGDDALETCRNIVSTCPSGAVKFCAPVALTEWGRQALLME